MQGCPATLPLLVQRLHLVGFTSELDGLIFSSKDGARSGGYVVALDSELLDAIREVLERRDRHRAPAPTAKPPLSFTSPRPPAQGSSLPPRDIQARLRAGRRIEEVALEAGVDDEWVRRFAAPIFAERAHVAARAQAAVLDVDGLGPSSSSLSGSVAANLADRGAPLLRDELEDGWDAYQLQDTSWVVEFRAPALGHGEPARWGFDTRTARLSALNPAGAKLGWVGENGGSASVFDAVEEAKELVASNGAEPLAEAPPAPPAEQLPLGPVAARPSRRVPARPADGNATPDPEPPRPAARARRAPGRVGAKGRAATTE